MKSLIQAKPDCKQAGKLGALLNKVMDSQVRCQNVTMGGVSRMLKDPGFEEKLGKALEFAFVTDEYSDEEAESSKGYSPNHKPSPVREQIAALRTVFPDLSIDKCGPQDASLPGGEQPIALPNIWRPEPVISGTYKQQVGYVLDALTREQGLDNQINAQIKSGGLKQSDHSVQVLKKMSESQGHPDILVVPAQFGIAHRGRSARRALAVMLESNQFGLGVFAIAIMLLTHRYRLSSRWDMWINCAGDTVKAKDDNEHVVVFDCKDGTFTCRIHPTEYHAENYSNPSGYLDLE